LKRAHTNADQALRNTVYESSQVFDAVLDGILIIDYEGVCLDANSAVAAMLRCRAEALIGKNISPFFVEDEASTASWPFIFEHKKQRGRARMIVRDGAPLVVDFSVAPDYLPGRLVLILCDVTELETARAEADALRKATLALSQNLPMDAALDTLLQYISELIPFDRAAVFFLEDGPNLMIARETPCLHPMKRIGLIVKVSDNLFLQKILIEKQSLLVSDVASDAQWAAMPPLDHLRSWLGIPLVAANEVLGVLSLGSNTRDGFTSEHVRLAESLAIPAAVAIQNARTHERAEIYASELERRLE